MLPTESFNPDEIADPNCKDTHKDVNKCQEMKKNGCKKHEIAKKYCRKSCDMCGKNLNKKNNLNRLCCRKISEYANIFTIPTLCIFSILFQDLLKKQLQQNNPLQ